MVKLSSVHRVINYNHRIKHAFKTKGKYRVKQLPLVEEALRARGITVEDPETFINPPPEKYVPNPEDLLPDFRSGVHEVIQEQRQKRLEAEGKEVWHLSDSMLFTEGVDQACLLTKAVKVSGLPDKIKHLVKKYSIPDQDQLVTNTIYRSQQWDNTKRALPKRFDPENRSWRFKREFGIPDSKAATYVLHDFLRYSQSMSGVFADLASERHILYKPETHLQYLFKGETINISSISEFMVYGKELLPPLADKASVEKTAEQSLFDMYPVSPTIDLQKRLLLPTDCKSSIVNPLLLSCSHPQILVRRNKVNNDNGAQAYNIMLTFATAYNEAKDRYGDIGGVLPVPVTVLNINGNYNSLNFLAFQLNTLDLHSSDGIKNIVWSCTNGRFFKRVKCQPWKHPYRTYLPTTYEHYHPGAFEKFLAVYLYDYDRKRPVVEKVLADEKEEGEQKME